MDAAVRVDLPRSETAQRGHPSAPGGDPNITDLANWTTKMTKQGAQNLMLMFIVIF